MIQLRGDPVNTTEVLHLEEENEGEGLLLEELIEMWQEYALELAGWIECYDEQVCYNPHEHAQLFGISEDTYKKFVREVALNGSLEESAMLHAETYSGNEDRIGDRCRRDHPMFDAVQFKFIQDLKKDPDSRAQLADYTNGEFDEVRIHLKMLDDELGFVKSQPNLTVVK